MAVASIMFVLALCFLAATPSSAVSQAQLGGGLRRERHFEGTHKLQFQNTADQEMIQQMQAWGFCDGREWQLSCWADVINNFKNEVSSKVDEVRGLVDELANIKPAIDHLGECTNTLPGAMPPLDALKGVFAAVNEDSLPRYVMSTYVSPLLERAHSNTNKALVLLENFMSPELSLLKEGKIDVAALEAMPEQMLGLAFAMAEIDPSMQCLMQGNFLEQLQQNDRVREMLGELLTMVTNSLMDLWETLTGPDSLIGRLVAKVTESVSSMLHKLLPAAERLETIVSDSVNTFCRTTYTTVLGYVQSNADVPAEFCSNTTGSLLERDLKAGMEVVLTSVLEFITTEAMAALRKYVWTPLMNQLLSLVGTAQASIMQIVDGLSGLIPEAGGPIAMMITTPIHAVLTWVVAQLTSGTVAGFIDTVEQLIKAEIPRTSIAVADFIVESGSALAPTVKLFVDNTVEPAMLAIKPVLDIVEPLINLAMETIAPKLKAALDTCKDDMAILEPLVKASLC